MLGLGLGVDKIKPSGVLPLLDLYPATAAYSLRALSKNTTNVVRVREDGTNTEQDFTAKEITDGTLATFCGANNGFVVTWYDQSGNANHATQATAASQPKIYDSSAGVVLENGNAAIDFDATDDRLSAGDVLDMGTDDLSIFAIAKQVVNNDGWFVSKLSTSVNEGYGLFHQNLARFRATIRNGGSSIGTSPTSSEAVNSQGLSTAIFDRSADMEVYFNGAFSNGVDISGFSASDISNNLDFYIGYAFSFVDRYYGGLIQEVILYNSDQSANRTAIESNINSHYNIYI